MIGLHWEYERVRRMWEGQPFERETLLLMGDGRTPHALSVNGVYRVEWNADGVHHYWGEHTHTDVPCLRESGWECAIYDEKLYTEKVLSVFDTQHKEYVDVPRRVGHVWPEAMRWSESTTWDIFLPEGEWEGLEQIWDGEKWIESRGHFKRVVHIEKGCWEYHAFLITKSGYEDKIIFQNNRANYKNT